MLACSPWLARPACVYTPGPPAWAGSSHVSHQSRECPTGCPPGQSGGGHSSDEGPSSQVALLYVKLTKDDQHAFRYTFTTSLFQLLFCLPTRPTPSFCSRLFQGQEHRRTVLRKQPDHFHPGLQGSAGRQSRAGCDSMSGFQNAPVREQFCFSNVLFLNDDLLFYMYGCFVCMCVLCGRPLPAEMERSHRTPEVVS